MIYAITLFCHLIQLYNYRKNVLWKKKVFNVFSFYERNRVQVLPLVVFKSSYNFPFILKSLRYACEDTHQPMLNQCERYFEISFLPFIIFKWFFFKECLRSISNRVYFYFSFILVIVFISLETFSSVQKYKVPRKKKLRPNSKKLNDIGIAITSDIL